MSKGPSPERKCGNFRCPGKWIFLIFGRLRRYPGIFVGIFGAQLRKANDPTGGCQAPAALLLLAARRGTLFSCLFAGVAFLNPCIA